MEEWENENLHKQWQSEEIFQREVNKLIFMYLVIFPILVYDFNDKFQKLRRHVPIPRP